MDGRWEGGREMRRWEIDDGQQMGGRETGGRETGGRETRGRETGRRETRGREMKVNRLSALILNHSLSTTFCNLILHTSKLIKRNLP